MSGISTSGLKSCGAGAGGTRNIAGTNNYHARGLAHSRMHDPIGEFNHALMIEGIRHSRSETRIFAHNDPRDLERKLSDLDQHAPSRNFVTSRMLTTPALPQSGFVRWRKADIDCAI